VCGVVTKKPSLADIEAYADRAGLALDDPGVLAEGIAEQDRLVRTLDDLPDPMPPDRDHREPSPEDDPNGAFLTRCDVGPTSEGPLSGLTVGVKDNLAVAGVPMTCGSPLLAGFVPAEDAVVVDRLRGAGARIVGKTNMDEFAMGGSKEAMRFRLARNPNNPEHQPGGSSAGSGVAVAEGSVDVALGTDTGGSVRFPASFCGVVGVKPSRGLVPLSGFVQYSKLNDTIGVLADGVTDAARTLSVIAGSHPTDAASGGENPEVVAAVADPDPTELTVGVPDALFGQAPEVDAIVKAAIDTLSDAGAAVRMVTLADFEYAVPAWWATAMTELAAYLDACATNYFQASEPSLAFTSALAEALADRPESLGRFVKGAVVYGRHLSDGHDDRYYARAQRVRPRVTGGVDAALAEVDVLAGPTTPMTAPEWGEGYLEDGSLEAAVRTTAPFNLTGHPAVSVPCGTHCGLPVGLQFVAPRGADGEALRAAAVWEALNAGSDA
jgi:Asp-tRNA(Asn)/Glu-tRNA(Gln) amidotransferase A subunit family amidase